MRKQLLVLLLLAALTGSASGNYIVMQRVKLSGNNLCTWFFNTGIFNYYSSTSLSGLTYPCESDDFFARGSGLSATCRINGMPARFSCSYEGELTPGYVENNTPFTGEDFKIYSVFKYDNEYSNPDYANWYKMIPFNAPYDDVNGNCIFDVGIDKPGIKDANQTLFICMTDAFIQQRNDPFGGISYPLLFAEVRMTAWVYNSTPVLEDVNFIKYEIINKGIRKWDSLAFSFFVNPVLGSGNTEFELTGCDTTSAIGYAYGNNGTKFKSYGAIILNGVQDKNTGKKSRLSSFTIDSPVTSCESIFGFSNYYGLKSDGSPILDPTKNLGGNKYGSTKFLYYGIPGSNIGWAPEDGRIANCGGVDTGTVIPSYPADRIIMMNTGGYDFSMAPADTQTIVYCQTVNSNSTQGSAISGLLSRLKSVEVIYNSDIKYIAENNCRNSIAGLSEFYMSQNYPNPYNASTVIQFSLPRLADVRLEIFDMLGRRVATPINKEMNAGYHSITLNSANFASGVYFYRIQVLDKTVSNKEIISRIKRMVIVK